MRVFIQKNGKNIVQYYKKEKKWDENLVDF